MSVSSSQIVQKLMSGDCNPVRSKACALPGAVSALALVRWIWRRSTTRGSLRSPWTIRIMTGFPRPSHAAFQPALRRLTRDRDTLSRPVISSPASARHPQHVVCPLVVEVAGEHEEVVRKAVRVTKCRRVDRLAGRELGHQALRPAHDRAREVEIGGSGSTTRQDKGVERFKLRVHRVDLAFEALDLGFGDPQRLRLARTA